LNAMPTMVSPQPTPPVEQPVPMPAAQPPVAPQPMDPPAGPPALAPLRSTSEAITRPSMAPTPPIPDVGTAPSQPTHASLSDVQHVRDRSVAIDFDVDHKGPSGVQKIEVFCTQDDGQTWIKYSESRMTSPPL